MIPSIRRSIFLCSIIGLLSADLAIQALNPQLVPNNSWQLPFLLGQIVRPTNSPLFPPADRPGGDDLLPASVKVIEGAANPAGNLPDEVRVANSAVQEYLSALAAPDSQARLDKLRSARESLSSVHTSPLSKNDLSAVEANLVVVQSELGEHCFLAPTGVKH